jgi:hypothetical protein
VSGHLGGRLTIHVFDCQGQDAIPVVNRHLAFGAVSDPFQLPPPVFHCWSTVHAAPVRLRTMATNKTIACRA